MNVYRVWLAGWVCENPLLSRAQHRPGINTVWIESQAVNCPVVCRPIKAPVARHSGLPDIWHGAEGWRDRAVIDDVLRDTELKQLHT